MRHFSKKLLTVLLVAVLSFTCLFAQAMSEEDYKYVGKTVILHSNDVHGAIEGYAKMATLRDDFEDQGAQVILVDAGDYSQGTTYVSISKGADAITMMNAVGYDVATIGNHEFDYGYEQLVENMSEADFEVLCADVFNEDGSTIFDANTVIKTWTGVKIGFFGLETPEAQTKANPALIKGLTFVAGNELYEVAQKQADELNETCDIVICLSHLGDDESSEPNTSYELYANTTGIDMIIDAHSHSVIEQGANGEPIQSTGTAFAYIGVIVIDNEGNIESNYLVSCDDIESDATVAAAASEIIDRVDTEFKVVFAKSLVELCGDKEPGNRTQETNNGDLITDAMRWSILKDSDSVSVPAENVVAVTNGGGIRAWIHAGDITKKDINTVLPFGNTVAVVYVTGAELLEALEASTFCTPVSIGGFPQVAGIEFTINTTAEYAKNAETYPGSTYYGPASINRVTINSVNGKAFDPEATYAVITNNFCAAGGDTYYAFASASSQFDTGLPLDQVVMDYITEVLNGVVSEEYAEPQGRIHVITAEEAAEKKITIGGLDANIWFTKYGNTYCDCKNEVLLGEMGISVGDLVKVKFNDQEVIVPVVTNYSDCDNGTALIKVQFSDNGSPTGYVELAINMGNFATTYGLATKTTNADKTWFWTAGEGVTYPVELTIELYEKEGYLAEYLIHQLTRTNNREDYANLTDEQFANFRQITTTGMGDNLYRTSNPANAEIGRNTYADAAAKAAGITHVINLSDDAATAQARAEYAGSYYSTLNVKYLNLGVDVNAAEFKSGLAEGLRFLAGNPGKYAVHCTEGKDRAGFVSAVLECLMGASADEVIADYMTTYYNYYGVEKGSEKYDAIANSNIVKTVSTAFGINASDFATADLASGAEGYLKSIGLTDAEIAAVKANLK